MLKVSSLLAAVLSLVFAGFALAAPINKCVVNGKVTFQQGLCPPATDEARKPPPTLEELNAAEKGKRAAAASAALAAPQKVASAPPAASTLGATTAAPAANPGFQCDGRKYCSQMRSCEEAKFFLANCPGVKMDGNRDGTPCEKQWCGRR